MAVAAATCLLLGGLAGSSAVGTTSAAWTNDAWASAAASTGTWVTAPTSSCVVLNAAGNPVTSKPCTITSLRAVDNNDGSPVGQRRAHMYLRLSTAPLASGETLRFTVDLRTATGLPSNWVWSNAGVTAGNLIASPGFACSSLPWLTAFAPSWASGGADVYFVLLENRTGQSGLICS